MLVVVVMMVVVVRVPTSPPVLLFVILLLTLGPALHGVCVGVCVGVRVGLQRGGGGQLLQGGVRGFHPDRGLAQQVDGVRQSGQNELKTLLKKSTFHHHRRHGVKLSQQTLHAQWIVYTNSSRAE